MSAGTPVIFIPAKKKLLTGGFNLSSDALKAALLTSTQVLSPGFIGASGDARFADLTNEVVGTGYTAGGQALAGVSLPEFVSSASIAAAGSGGTNGTNQIVSGTTGAGTKFQAAVDVTGGAISAVRSINLPGNYTARPTNPANEPVSGLGLTGAALNLAMGAALTFTNPAWPNSTLTAKYLVIYDNSQPNKDLLAYVDLETTQPLGVSTTNGTLSYLVSSSGLVQLV